MVYLLGIAFDGKLFNLRRLQAKCMVQTEVLDEFLFADDMAKGAPTEKKMQKGVVHMFGNAKTCLRAHANREGPN